ncbi:MAG: C40 family peptidase, partial [Gaiellales bacterium]
DQLLPGDLVFFGSDLHHVGMYIGNGQFIHAPHTGDVVKISNLSYSGDYAGAVRPY